jgi:hypothetical protein
MRICPSCKVRYEEDKELCSRCGANLVEEISEKRKSSQRGKKTSLVLVLGLSIIPITFVIVAAFFWLEKGLVPKNQPILQVKVSEPFQGKNPSQGQPSQTSLNRFDVGRKWLIDWKSLFKYRGVMQIRQQLAANQYLAKITVSFLTNKNKQITVSMDGRLNINGAKVIINCSNASESWWDTDDFYLEWHNDTMTGYNIDKKGRRGHAVFQFVDVSP